MSCERVPSRAVLSSDMQPNARTLSRLIIVGLGVGLASPATGCFWATSKNEGDALRRDVSTIQLRLEKKQQILDVELAQLQKVLDEATKLLKRNSADLGADVDQLRNEMRKATGLATAASTALNDLKQSLNASRKTGDARLDTLEARIAQLESGKPAANSSPADLWKLGTRAFEVQRYNDAIDIFKRLTSSYPTNDRADDAVYFKGQSFGHMRDWEHAIGAYQQLTEKYPDSSLADDGLYFAAVAAKELKNCTEARTYLSIIRSKYGKSNVSKVAVALETLLKKEAKKKSVCTS